MILELKSVVWDKYMGTDIDSVPLFFDEESKNPNVEEFDVPEEEKYLVFYSENEDASINWVEIINPESIVNSENVALPDVSVRVDDKVCSLKRAIEMVVGGV